MKRPIELRDVPTIIGASKNPSPWELWNILAGIIPETSTLPATAFWRKALRPSIITGLQSRYNATFTPLPPVNTPDSPAPVNVSGALKIVDPGSLPISAENRSDLLLIRQVSDDALAFNWKQDNQITPPLAEIARAHIFMMAYGTPRCTIYAFTGGGSSEHIVEIDYDRDLAQEIIDQIENFRLSVETNNEPAPDFAIDLKALEARYRPTNSEPIDLTNHPGVATLISTYQELTGQKSKSDATSRDLDKKVKEFRAKIQALLKDHQVGLIAPGLAVECKEITVAPRQADGYTWHKISVVTSATGAEQASASKAA